MATIDSSMLSVTYGAILASSSIIKQKFWDCMEQLEDNPSGFPELDDVPERIRTAYANLTWRKIYLESNKHSFRLVFAQLEVFRGQGHTQTILDAFLCKRGYPIDWDSVDNWLENHSLGQLIPVSNTLLGHHQGDYQVAESGDGRL